MQKGLRIILPFRLPTQNQLLAMHWRQRNEVTTCILADEDGRSVKAAVDGLREAGIFEDDSPEFVTGISQSQEQTDGDEETIIEVTWEDPPASRKQTGPKRD